MSTVPPSTRVLSPSIAIHVGSNQKPALENALAVKKWLSNLPLAGSSGQTGDGADSSTSDALGKSKNGGGGLRNRWRGKKNGGGTGGKEGGKGGKNG